MLRTWATCSLRTVTDLASAPWGYDVWTHTEVVPKDAPILWRWRIGPVLLKPPDFQPEPGSPGSPALESEITVQLTADQQVNLSISGEDKYGNPVDVSGDTTWTSSDESVVQVNQQDPSHATAVAVGPVGSAAVTVTNDTNSDGTGDFIGSISIDVVAGVMAEIVVTAEEPTDKPA